MTSRVSGPGAQLCLRYVLALFTVLSFFPAVPASVPGKLKVAGVLVVAVWAVVLIVDPAARPPLNRVSAAVTATGLTLVGWALLSASWAIEPGTAVTSASRLAMGVALAVVVYTCARELSAVRVLVLAYVLGAVLTVLYGVIVNPGPPIPGAVFDPTRLTGGVGDPNELASVLLPAVALAVFGLPLATTRVERAALTVGAVLALVGVLLSESRGAAVAAVVMVVAGIALGGRYRLRLVALVTVLVGCGAVYWVWFASESSTIRFASVFRRDAFGRMSDGAGRIPLWKQAAELSGEYPILGVGAGNFRVAVAERAVDCPTDGSRNYENVFCPNGSDANSLVHNTYMQVLAEMGIVGLVLFVVLAGGAVVMSLQAVRRATRDRNELGEFRAKGALVALIALLSTDVFLSGEYQLQLWWLLGLTYAVAARTLRSSERVDLTPEQG